MSPADTPARLPKASPLLHLRRAFGWNVGRMTPTPAEAARLSEAGLAAPAIHRYAVWRRSLLLVAAIPTAAAFLLAVLDALGEDFGELTIVGEAIHLAWFAAAACLPVACLLGVRGWTRPGAASRLLIAAWGIAFLLPFALALIPVDVLYHVEVDGPHVGAGTAPAEKIESLQEMALDFVLSGSAYLLLLPAVLSLIPGAMNGCLRIKAAFPAAQLPGWLLVSASPVFLLLWLVLLVVLNHAAQSPLLVLGVLLWAGSPLLYAFRRQAFVRSQITADDAATIGRVKRLVGIVALSGAALLVAFVSSEKVAGLSVLGTDRATAMSTRLDALTASDDEVGLEDVSRAFEESTSFAYVFDLSSYRFLVDLLAKLLLVTAVFADLILRVTLVAWGNDRVLRARVEATDYDASAEAAIAALGPVGRASPTP